MKVSHFSAQFFVLCALANISANPALAHFDEDDVTFFKPNSATARPIAKQSVESLVPDSQHVSITPGATNTVQYFYHPIKPRPVGLVARAQALAETKAFDSQVAGSLRQRAIKDSRSGGRATELKVHGNILPRLMAKPSQTLQQKESM